MALELAGLFEGKFDQLTPKQQDVVRVLSADPVFASYASVHDVARRAEVDPATVIRLAKVLGFKGYPQLRHNIRHYLLDVMPDEERYRRKAQFFQGDQCVTNMLLLDIRNLRSTLEILDIDALDKLARDIVLSPRTLVVSSGTYAALGMVFSQICRAMGYRVYLESGGGPYLSSALATLEEGDLVFGICFWRGLRETVIALKWAKRHGIKTAALTDAVVSPAAGYVDTLIVASSEGALFFQSLTAPLSVLYALALKVWELTPQDRRSRYQEIRRLQKELNISFEPPGD